MNDGRSIDNSKQVYPYDTKLSLITAIVFIISYFFLFSKVFCYVNNIYSNAGILTIIRRRIIRHA